MKLITFFLFAVSFCFQTGDRVNNLKREEAREELPKKPARDPRNFRSYTHTEWCNNTMYYFMNPQAYMAAMKKAYGMEFQELDVQSSMLRQAVIAGCEW